MELPGLVNPPSERIERYVNLVSERIVNLVYERTVNPVPERIVNLLSERSVNLVSQSMSNLVSERNVNKSKKHIQEMKILFCHVTILSKVSNKERQRRKSK